MLRRLVRPLFLVWITAAGSCRCASPTELDPADAARDASPVGDAAAEDASASPDASALDDAGPDAGEQCVDAAPPDDGPKLHCPTGMMAVARRFCIDRWEASLVDVDTGAPISPYYPPDKRLAKALFEQWDKERLVVGDEHAHEMPLPPLPPWQRERQPNPKAVSRPNVVPNGYLSGEVAARACANAGKRLCTHDEWVTACKGRAAQQFPYGEKYVQGACNIFRSAHPAKTLHDNASVGHLDPRLNLVTEENGSPLLRRTGATPRCKSEWDDDAAWDMNGNLDEWVQDEHGMFLGGFYSRSKRDGCESEVRAHPNAYFDYSTGVRCCGSP